MRTDKRGRMPASSTPNYDRGTHHRFLRGLATTILAPAILFGAIAVFGLPGLRFQARYYGNEDYKQYVLCDYLTIHGFVRLVPSPGINQCSLFKSFPAF